jgi:tetratricopeptide (TPR) repeat protein
MTYQIHERVYVTAMERLFMQQKYSKAEQKYYQAVTTFEKRVKANMNTHLPSLAKIHVSYAYLKKIAALKRNSKPDHKKAFKSYKQAFKMYKYLTKRDLQAHGLDYAKLLVLGTTRFNQTPKYIEIAKKVLTVFPNTKEAKKLSKQIKRYENNVIHDMVNKNIKALKEGPQ